jgi:4'-phosphopantetheinyl transferase
MRPLANWCPPPAVVNPADHEVHLWRAFLDTDDVSLQLAQAALSADERMRASRFVFPRDQNRFIVSRWILRSLIGRYTRRSPASVEFTYEPLGKPRLCSGNSDPPLRFNVSHSQGLAVYAFSRTREIGVDVEAIRSDISGDEIAEQFFSSRELAELRSLTPEERDQAFFLCWTRKEAYVKASGTGLLIPLDSFDVSLTPGKPETLLSADAGRWKLLSFQPQGGYAGAIVAEGNDWRLCLWDFSPQP